MPTWETSRQEGALVIASGHFTLGVHAGHVRYLSGAAKLAHSIGGRLVVIVNNDRQVRQKGYEHFLSEAERREIVGAIAGVSGTVLSVDTDRSVCQTLKVLVETTRTFFPFGKLIFANGGDVEGQCLEEDLCRELGISLEFGVGGGKVNSTSTIYKAIRSQSE